MAMNSKHAWENLPEDQRTVWTQHVIKFYPPNTVSLAEALELAREEYNESESPLPLEAVCEAD